MLKKIKIGIVKKQDILENPVKSIYLGLGSNLGNKRRNIEKAKSELYRNNIEIIKSSSYYESLSWPNTSHPKFFNIVVEIKSNLNPISLLKTCKKIELCFGRRKPSKNSPRKCDIDIIDYNSTQFTNGIILPHPRMHKRSFVLLPLFQLNKEWMHPILKINIKTLIKSLPIKDITSIKQI